jgi:hypothetical protein
MSVLGPVLLAVFQGLIAGIVVFFSDGPKWAVAATSVIVAHIWLAK